MKKVFKVILLFLFVQLTVSTVKGPGGSHGEINPGPEPESPSLALFVFDPNGGEVLTAGSTYPITWSSTGSINDVLIEYSTDNGSSWKNITTVPNTGSYNWLVPAVNSNQCLVRVTDAANPSISDTSDAVFTIQLIPQGMVWVYINDPGVSGHEGFNGQISKYETTNTQYCQLLNAAKATGDITISGDKVIGASGSNRGADFVGQVYYDLTGLGYTDGEPTGGGAARIHYSGGVFIVDNGFENHPVTYVSWYGATAFCNYYGYRLPTEWEWQAVADYDGIYTYGCGTVIDNSIANYRGSTHPYGTTEVGAFGSYGYGMCDMAGNVYEWTSSFNGDGYVLRGGFWDNTTQYVQCDFRNVEIASGLSEDNGFRVVSEPEPPCGRIAFVSDRHGNEEIYLMNADGSNQIRLTNDPGVDAFPVFSPDGRTIAFISNRSGSSRIYTMRWNGSDLREVPHSECELGYTTYCRSLAWAPDGQKLLFRPTYDSLATINLDGSGKTILLMGGVGEHDVIWGPEWGPTMDDVYFNAQPYSWGYDQHIFHYSISGRNWTQITADVQPMISSGPKVSRAISRIVYFRQEQWGHGRNIFTMDLDGGNMSKLTYDVGVENATPDWAGETGDIVFWSDKSGNRQIWLMDSKGGNARMLPGEGNNYAPSWTPLAEPPIANAGDNIQIASAEQVSTIIYGTATDADGDLLEYHWLEGEEVLLDWSAVGSGGEAYLDLATLPYLAIGNHTLILEAREVKSGGLSASDEMVLTIENSPPVVQAAPKHQVVEVGVDPIVVVGDAGDFDGDTLVYKWLDDSNNVLASGIVATTPGGEPVTIPDLNVSAGDTRFPVGEHTVRLQVSDGINEPVTDSVSVEVADTTAPSLSPVPSVTILWPPNHKLIPVTIWANTFDNGGGDIVLSVTVQSSEPADAIGDGNTDVDYYIDSVNNETGVIELRLRSERSGKGGGRVYTITITATDANQNQSNAVVQIRAPHDKSKK
jgi:Tol biopolymer transport system component